MQNGHDAAPEPPAPTAGHLTAEQLALDQLMTATEDMLHWTVLAEHTLREIVQALDTAGNDEDFHRGALLTALAETAYYQHQRLGDVLCIARRTKRHAPSSDR